ncbi:MAG TPA: methyltransferase domain-containing protein [Polyangiaceae bacterium]|jgi:ubiquinone/menaquinone biosynthesis C-methylase UbiE
MQATDAKFTGSIPELYERHLAPLLFEPYAEDLARRLSDLQRGTLVEVAAGTGVVTRALRRALPSDVRIVATDLNPGMLNVAASRMSAASVSFQQADAQQLPFADASAEAIVCQFGLMFVPDKSAAQREAARVLVPGGRFVFNVWDRLANNEVSLIVTRAVEALYPQDPPRFFERTPFGYFDAGVIRAELQAAGFQHIEIDTVELVSQATSAEQVAIGLCQGTPLRGEIEARNPEGLAAASAAAASALHARFGAGPFQNRMSALVVSARRP